VIVAGVVVALVVRNELAGHGSAQPRPAATPTPTAASPSPTTGPTSEPAQVVVSDVGHRMLGVTGRWELFARGASGVVRIELARGRVTTTAVPPLSSTGPVSFVVGRDWAVIRPLDRVAGYLVPDGKPARGLAAALDDVGPALPGPDDETLWVQGGSPGQTTMTLVGADGRPTGTSVRLPADANGFAEPDGTGRLMFYATGGVYLAGRSGVRRITSGVLVAVGPTRWVVRECDDRHRCATVVVDRNTGARRTLDVQVGQPYGPVGLISPDGSNAAFLENTQAGLVAAHLIDLASGTDRRLDVPVNQPYGDAAMAWSPDGRWLFIAGADGQLFPVDPATGRVHDLGVSLPPISQLAIRMPG
jgi:WD40-like Beta Propeller Repeat